jgi:hypothetical protein
LSNLLVSETAKLLHKACWNIYSDGMLFSLDGDAAKPAAEHPKEIAAAVDDLAAVLSRALASDVQGIGSPLYAHLPGLKPVNWDGIEISRARYFGTLQQDWDEAYATFLRRRANAGKRLHHCFDGFVQVPSTKTLVRSMRELLWIS